MSLTKIEPGIYRHFKGKLYFVLGLAWSRNDPNNPERAEVIYHPLYQVDNLGWRRDINPKKFLENVGRPEFNYSGPRFVKIADWKLPNILPGFSFKQNGCSYIIIQFHQCPQCDDGKIQVTIKQRILGAEWQDNVVKSLDWLKGIVAWE